MRPGYHRLQQVPDTRTAETLYKHGTITVIRVTTQNPSAF